MTLKLKVRLYGMLGRSIKGYDHLSGLDIQLPEGSTVHDLLVHLDVVSKRVGMVVMDVKPVQAQTLLEDGALIKILQPISGG